MSVADALKLQRGDRVVAEKSGDTGRVFKVTPREDSVLISVDLDGGGWWTYDSSQVEREARDE